MKALTLWQPWATAIAHLGKDVENRTWSPPRALLGKPLAIHAGQRVDKDSLAELLDQMRLGMIPNRPDLLSADRMPKGHVVALAKVSGWLCSHELLPMLDPDRKIHQVGEATAAKVWTGPWWVGPVGWVFGRVLALPEPVPCKGAQGLWVLPQDVRDNVVRQVQTLTVER